MGGGGGENCNPVLREVGVEKVLSIRKGGAEKVSTF